MWENDMLTDIHRLALANYLGQVSVLADICEGRKVDRVEPDVLRALLYSLTASLESIAAAVTDLLVKDLLAGADREAFVALLKRETQGNDYVHHQIAGVYAALVAIADMQHAKELTHSGTRTKQ
jgi:hypothetical protein